MSWDAVQRQSGSATSRSTACLHAAVVIRIARCVLCLKVLPPLLPIYDALQRVIEFRDRIGFGENAVETIVSEVVHHLGLGISP